MAAFGARGTGKTAFVKQLLARTAPPRLIIWDYKHDPSLKGLGVEVRSLQELIQAVKAPTFQVRYLVRQDGQFVEQFETFCRIAWAAGNLTMFVDELPEVTKANRAPPAWRKCVNVGREYVDGGKVKRISIIGAGQRPSECDKSFIANVDTIHCGRLGDMGDAKRMGTAWGVSPAELANLPDLHFIEKHAESAGITRGVLSFGNEKTAISAPKKKAKKSA